MKAYFTFLMIVFYTISFSQTTSQFSKKYQFEEEASIGFEKTLENKNNFHVVMSKRLPEDQIPLFDNMYLFDINKNTGLLNYGKEIKIPGDTIGFRRVYSHGNLDNDAYYLFSNRVSFYDNTSLSYKTISCGDASGILWSRQIPLDYSSNLQLVKKNDNINLVYQKNVDNLNSLEVFQLDIEGNPISQYSIASDLNFPLVPVAIDVNDNNFIIGSTSGQGTSSILLSLSTDGLITYKILRRFRVDDLKILSSGDIILCGRTQIQTTDGIENSSYLHIMKFSSDLEVILAKTIYTSPNNSFLQSVTTAENNRFFISVSSLGAKIHYNLLFDSNGDLVKKRGVPFGYESILNDEGSTYIVNGLSNSFSIESNELVIARTDQNYQLDQCETYDGCISEGSYDYEFFDFELFLQESTETLIPFEFTSEPFTLSCEDYCETIPPPLADFVTADTLCRNDCFIPTETFNETSESIEWQLTGEGIDSIFSEFTEPFCLDKAGFYTLMQTVWFFGCSESYVRNIEVLPDLDIYFDVDTFLCQSPPFVLPVLSNRDLTQIIWQDSSQTSDYQVLNDGMYSVTATDDYCSDSTEITLEFTFSPDFIPEFFVGRDTVICPSGTTPITIRPRSNFTDIFTLNGVTDSIFVIDKPGEYSFSAQADAVCIFYESLQVDAADCRPGIYLPTVFSPNLDGVNDKWQAVGVDFEVLELTVFDRWGSLLLQDNSALGRWDGTWRGEQMPQGVYVIVLRYRNTKTGEEGMVSGDVSLVR